MYVHYARSGATAAYNVATAQEARGRIGDALDAYERTVQLAMHARNAALEARARFAIANVMSELKLTDRALRHAEAAERAAQRVPLLAALCATLAGEARGDWMQIARARAKLPADRQEGIEALEIALSEARVRGQTTAHALIAWAERLLATDLLARAQLLASDDDLAIGALEELAPRLSGWRALDVYERLAKVCAARGASLRAREHAEAALRVGEALLVEIPAGLRESLATRLTRLRAPNAASAPEPSPQPSEDFARLFELQARLTNAPDVDGLLGLALDSAIASAGAERGFVMFARGEQLEVRAARNLDAERLSARESSFSRSVVQEALRSQTPLFAARIDGADDFLQRQRSVHAQRLRAVVVLPFTTTRGARGALYLDNRFVATAPSPRAKELLLFLRDQIAQALDRALLIDELAAQNRELERQRAELAELLRAERVEQERRAEGERRLRARRASAGRFPDIVGDSEVLQRALGLLERVAPTDVTVLLEGESGTGKELFARALHRASTRAEAPFVAINCGAIPEALLEAELFGAVRGAFTGSVKDTRGLFVTADGGTLLLDEIGEMPLAMQVKLLRVLQQREVRALGAERAQPIDVRIVTATHRDLDARVREGLFREDLFFRLPVVKIHIPPLRERGADVITIAERILDRAGERLGLPRPTLGTSALRALSQHAFPGNVRELENVLTKALVLGAHESTLEAEHLGLATTPWRRTQRAPAVEEEKTLRAALSANGGNVVQAAKQLGMPRATFYRKLARYGIEHRQS